MKGPKRILFKNVHFSDVHYFIGLTVCTISIREKYFFNLTIMEKQEIPVKFVFCTVWTLLEEISSILVYHFLQHA